MRRVKKAQKDLTKQMVDGTLPKSWLKMRSRLKTDQVAKVDCSTKHMSGSSM